MEENDALSFAVHAFKPTRLYILGLQTAFLLLLLGIFSGCFHKDLMSDRADDIKATLLYQGPGGTLIISKELIFQANNKSNENGVTMISGYSELRLSSYKIESGELAGRVELGAMVEEANELLGFSDGKIWMFSLDPALGLHYRDPLTLEVKESWAELSQRPALIDFKPARPDWPIINQYFAYDWLRQVLLLTDEQGFKYALNPKTFSLEPFEGQMPNQFGPTKIFNSSGQLSTEMQLSLQGNPRKQVICNNIDHGADLSFLSGEWILDPSPLNAGERMRKHLEILDQQIKAVRDSIASMMALNPSLAQEPKWSTMDREIWDQRRKMDDMNRQLDRLLRDRKQAEQPNAMALRDPILTGDGKSAYIHHANIIADTARSMISRINIAADLTCKLAWSSKLPGIFFNSSKADQAGGFAKVYSKGNPVFSYEWAATDGKHLVLLRQLQLIVLDMETGQLLWQLEI